MGFTSMSFFNAYDLSLTPSCLHFAILPKIQTLYLTLHKCFPPLRFFNFVFHAFLFIGSAPAGVNLLFSPKFVMHMGFHMLPPHPRKGKNNQISLLFLSNSLPSSKAHFNL